jgi:hypothetical protein
MQPRTVSSTKSAAKPRIDPPSFDEGVRTMTFAIIAEKPSVAELALPGFDPGEDRVLAYVNPFVSLNSNFEYPRGAKWVDYPIVRDVRYKSRVFMLPPFGKLRADEEEVAGKALVARIRTCDRVIFVGFPDSSTTLAYRLASERIFPEGLPPGRVFHIVANGTNWRSAIASVADSLRTMTPIDSIDPELCRPAEIKRRFDYNFNLNSFAVLGDVMRAVGATGPALTKVAVQTLYLSREAGPQSDGKLCELMAGWEGTGRYVNPWVGLGSVTSRASVIEGLADIGLLDRNGRRRSLSDRGRHFLDLLHPDCHDPDLPFRIEEWSRLPREEAYPKVDRYIRTYFGRQKRFAERRLAAPS